MLKLKKWTSILLCFAILFVVSACTEKTEISEDKKKPEETVTPQSYAETTKENEENADETQKPEEVQELNENSEEDEIVNIQITMEDGGVMLLELYPDKAPKTVANFVKLAKEGFYDGLTFHRIIEGFMIQGGDPMGTGMGGSDENIVGEFAMNGFAQNDIQHVRGVISMARATNPNSASSQFFIMHKDAPHLDGQYAAFGMLTEGFDVLDRLAQTKVGFDGQTPVAKPVIKTITVQ